MSTLDICDRVMIIIDGKLVAFDTISFLQQHNPYYRAASAHATGGRLPEPESLADPSGAAEGFR
jgi:ABC-type multidrug transport system ATPase subunit